MPKAVWHFTGVGPLHTCVKSKSPKVCLQQHRPAVSLFCTAAVSKGQLCFAKSSVARHWCWTTAHLCQEQISIGVFAATQACCQPVLHSSSEQGATVLCQKQCGTALVLGHCTPVSRANLHRCICSNTSLLSACFAQQH